MTIRRLFPLWGNMTILGSAVLVAWMLLSLLPDSGRVVLRVIMVWLPAAATACQVVLWWNEIGLRNDMRALAGGDLESDKEAAFAGQIRLYKLLFQAGVAGTVCFLWTAVVLSAPDILAVIWWTGLPLWGLFVFLGARAWIVGIFRSG